MSASPTTNDRNLALLTKAREMIAKGDLKNAAITLNDANRAMPGDARVFMLGGLMAEKAGNTTGAFELLRKTVKMAPEWGPGLLELALLLARNNQFPEAIATAEKVQQLEPNNPMVLAGSIDIAHRAGRLDIAVRLLRHGLRLHPNDPQLTFELANDLATLGSQQEALALWNQLIENNPSAPDLLLGRLKTQIALNNFSAAQSDAAKLVAIAPNDERYQYYADLSNGLTPIRQPGEVAQRLFDAMAPTYDLHMVRDLQYKLPKHVADRLRSARATQKFNLLDLGCGTGLLGVALGKIKGAMVGVDVSLEMIEMAARHNIYDKFHTVNIHDALEATPESLYEVIAALDVFIYAGDATKAIPNAHRILVPEGTFVASFESASEEGPDLALLPTGRYAHKRSNIVYLCEVAGFANIETENITLRLEKGEPVHGFIVWATKAASKPAQKTPSAN